MLARPAARRLRRLLVVVAALALAVGAPASQADYEDQYTAEAQELSQSLKTVSTALGGLNDSLKLWEQLRYGTVSPGGSDDLRLGSIFAQSLAAEIDATAASRDSIHDLENALNFDKTYAGGVRVKLATTISPHGGDVSGGFDVDLGIDVTRSGSAQIDVTQGDLTIKGGALQSSYALSSGDVTTSSIEKLRFHFDPGAPAGQKLYLVTPTAKTTLVEAAVRGLADLDSTPLGITFGFAKADVRGDIDGSARLRASVVDPDGNGKLTETELASTAPADLFDIDCVSASAKLDLDLDLAALDAAGTKIGGISDVGSVDLNDTDVCSGLDTPTVQLGTLGDFRNLTPKDFLNGIAQISSALDAMGSTLGAQEDGNPAAVKFPFVKKGLQDVVRFNEKLRQFLQDIGVWNGVEPVAISIPEAKLDPTAPGNIATAQALLPKLATTLGITLPTLNGRFVRVDLDGSGSGTATAPQLVFDVTATRPTSAAPVSLGSAIDFGDALRGLGISSVDGSSASVSIDPSYSLKLPVAVDLTAPADPENPPSILSRVSILTDATTPELTADLPVSANLDLGATVGFLAVGLKDTNSAGAVTMLTRRDPSRPMLSIELGDGLNDDDRLSLQELFDTLTEDPSTTGGLDELLANREGIFNATVPQFGLEADVRLTSGASLITCGSPATLPRLTIQWEQPGVGVPQIGFPDSCFNDKVLSFDFAADDPTKLFGVIMQGLAGVADELDKLADTPEGAKLREELPLIGKSFKDLIADFRQVKGMADTFLADPTGSLNRLQRELATRLVEAIVPVDPAFDGENRAAGWCSDTIDSDGDGYVNDGCAATGNPEVGDACLDNRDENTLGSGTTGGASNREGDSAGNSPAPDAVNDGCAARKNGQSVVRLELKPATPGADGQSGTSDDGRTAIIFRIGFGICGIPNGGAPVPTYCTIVRGVQLPLNLDTGVTGASGGGLGGIVQVQSSGELNLDYRARVNLAFGVELPRLVRGKPTPVVPVDNHPKLEELRQKLAAERACVEAGGTPGCSGSDPSQTYVSALKEYYVDAVQPKVDAALAITCGSTDEACWDSGLAKIQDAFQSSLSLQRQAVLLGLEEELDEEMAELNSQADGLFQVAYDQVVNKKLAFARDLPNGTAPDVAEQKISSAIQLAIGFERQRQLLGMESDTTVIVDSVGGELAERFFTLVVKARLDAAKAADPFDFAQSRTAIEGALGWMRQRALLGVGSDENTPDPMGQEAWDSINELTAKFETLPADLQRQLLNPTAPKPVVPVAAPAAGGSGSGGSGGGGGSLSIDPPRLFLLDSTGITLEADFAATGSLTANIGSVQVGIGSNSLSPETACDETSPAASGDDDSDGTVNDGCPAVDAAESGLQCADNDDDDADAKVNDGCPATADLAYARLRASFGLAYDVGTPNGAVDPTTGIPANEDRVYLDSPTNLVNHLKGMLPTGFSLRPTTQVTCPGSSTLTDACASLPVYYDLDGDGPASKTLLCRVGFEAPNLMQPSTWGFTGLTGPETDTCQGALENAALDWHLWLQGLTALSHTLEQALEGASYDVKVPVLGEALDGGADIVGKFNDNVLTPLNTFADQVKAVENGGYGAISTAIKNGIWDNVRLSPTQTLLVDWNDDGTVDKADVNVIGRCDDGKPATKLFMVQVDTDDEGRPVMEEQELTVGDGVDGPTVCLTAPAAVDREPLPAGGHRAGHIKDIQLRISIGQDIASYTLPDFDIGFPGLRLEMNNGSGGSLSVGVDWRINLALGIDRETGFYLGTDKLAKGENAELNVNAGLFLPTNTKGELAFVGLDITDHTDGTHQGDSDLDFSFGGDLEGGNARSFLGGDPDTGADTMQNRLELSDLLEGRDPANPAQFSVLVSGGVSLDLRIDTQVNIPALSSDPGSLPSLRVEHFILDWSWSSKPLTSFDDSNAGITIALNEVQLGLGKWVSDFLRPIVLEVQKYTKPMQPVIDTVTTPIPVLTDFAEAIGEEPLTILRILELQQQANGQPGSLDMIKRLIYLISFVNSIPTPSGAAADLYVPIGDFPIVTSKVRDGVSGDQADTLIGTPANLQSVLGRLGQVSSGFQDKVAEAQTSKGGFSFPAFQQPTQLVHFLLGKDVTLVQYDTGVLKKDVVFQYKYGPPIWVLPLSVSVTATFGVEGRFIVGYDTKGIRSVFQLWNDGDAANNDVLASAALLFQGVYVSDLDLEGLRDVPEIKLRASVVLAAQVDIKIAQAGIDGGIYGELDLNLHDGLGNPPNVVPGTVDGKLRIDEIVSRIKNPICLFDTDGSIYAKAALFVDVETPFGKARIWEHVLGRGEILSLRGLTDFCFQPPVPVLAKISGNTLVLNMGSAARRAERAFKEEVTSEKFLVRQLDPSGKKFSVTFAGLTQEFSHGSRLSIYADGAGGNDTIDLAAGGMNLASASSPTQSVVPFDSAAVLCGGAGDDVLTGGGGGDKLYGDGAPNATLTSCSSTEASDDGADLLNGGDGADTLFGGGAADVLKGENGNDPQLEGGSGNDNVSGGFGADTIRGQDGADMLVGGPELDPSSAAGIAQGVTAASVIDTIEGGIGDDSISGETGNDVLKGGNDADTIRGSIGDDTITGEAGHDKLYGDEGADSVDGGADNDEVYGGVASDTLNGGTHDDILVGGADATSPTTGLGAGDTLNGGDGADWLLGDEGSVLRTTPTGVRTETLGPGAHAGRDTLNGGTGADRLWGQGAPDTLNGDADADVVWGADGGDTISGGTGADELYGEAGSDTMNGNGDADTMRGGDAADTMNGDEAADSMFGDSGTDSMNGGTGDDTMRGGIDADTMHGDADADAMFGEAAADTMFGDGGADVIHGDADDDDVEGNDGGDTIFGDAGADDLVGGSSTAGAADGGDTINGADGAVATVVAGDHDVILGDNGTITPASGLDANGSRNRTVVLHDLASTTAGGADTIAGEEGHDRIYGGGQSDAIQGNADDDAVEGNGGGDTIGGGSGQDDLTGGSSQGGGDAPDGGDTIGGDAGFDVIAGDNASITRGATLSFDTLSATAANIVRRTVVLYDVATVSSPQTGESSSGGDTLGGGDAYDRLYGQGGSDAVNGGDGEDYAEGNSGADTVHGDAGSDDLVGGTGRISYLDSAGTVQQDGAGGTAGRLDAGDQLYGDGGYDVIAGDNALLVRTLAGGVWSVNTFNGGVAHDPRVLLDADSADAAAVSGDDRIEGGTEDDLAYGQGGADTMLGNPGDDAMEGNGGADTMNGNEDQDDLVGGTTAAGAGDVADTIHGDASFDVILGDNGTISRPLAAGLWTRQNLAADAPGVVHRVTTLFDVATAAAPTAGAGKSGGDTIAGDDGFDVIQAQGGDDTVSGGNGDDRAYGNAGADVVTGDAGRDDLVGGTGRTTSNDATTAVDGRLDGADRISGGDGGATVATGDEDAIVGDNGIVDRPLTADAWEPNTFDAGVVRAIRLLDVDTVATPATAGTSGGDTLRGEAGNDLLFGGGAADDIRGDYVPKDATVLTATAGHDYVEGNGGTDTIRGDGSQDDVAGGGSANDGVIDADRVGDGLRDGVDTIYGDDGDPATPDDEADVIAGDNARLGRLLTAGLWRTDVKNTGDDVIRDVQLFDVERVGAPVDPATFGGDTVFGEGAHDLLFGQGSADTIRGGDEYDYVEGNHGADDVQGNEAEDDLIGGSSALNGHVGVDPLGVGLTDGADRIEGNAEDDVILGDNARIVRPLDDGPRAGLWKRLEGGSPTVFDIVVRETSVSTTAEQAGAFGDDRLFGNDGHDDIVGELGGDVIEGNAGEDAVVGDLGQIRNNLLGDRYGPDPAQAAIKPNQPFIASTVNVPGTLYRPTELYAYMPADNGGGADVIRGGDGGDSLHAGPGDDIVNGDRDDDRIFAADGADVAWGGEGNDHLYGGHGPDHLDVKPRTSRDGFAADPDAWFAHGAGDFEGRDYIYGGWDQDAMQANISSPGTSPDGDRLMDWMGAYNVYYRCDSSNGAYVTIRSPAPGLQAYLEDQSRGDGVLAPQTRNSSGWRELGMVRRGDYNQNNNPVHPDNPGHFTCSEGSSAPATGTTTTAKLPDLAVDTPDIALSRTSIVEGDKVTITATVRNVGTLAASNVSVRFTDGRNEIGSTSIAKINAGSSGKASVTWETRDWENLNGDEVIVVLADVAETIVELSEQNNEGRKIVDVIASKTPNGSFEVSTSGTAPDGWTPVGTTAWIEGGTDGARSVTVAAPPAGWSSAPIPVAAGTAYSLAVKVTHLAASVKVEQLDAAGTFLTSTAPSFATVSSGVIGSKVFYTRQASFTAVAGATQVRIVLAGAVSTTPTTFDDIRVW